MQANSPKSVVTSFFRRGGGKKDGKHLETGARKEQKEMIVTQEAVYARLPLWRRNENL